MSSNKLNLAFDRRVFLKAAGITLALPAMESLARPGNADADTPRRLVCIGNEFGMYPVAFWPTKAGVEYELPLLLEPLLRRLNAREYRNTLRDLLHLDVQIFDPTTDFPKDQTVENLDNVGETLVTSGHLLEQYLEAAEQAIDKAILTREKPAIQKWTFRDNFKQQYEIDRVHKSTSKFQWLTLYEVAASEKHEGAYAPIYDFAAGVPTDGFYKIRFEAESLNRIHPYDPQYLGMDPDERYRLGIVPGDHTAGQLYKPQVALANRYRGGLLGQASVLTVTANGIDTSPVVRGIWVLENILGDPPNPPPPDVEPLDPDIRGAKTIRDQLRKHRDVATCYDCHRKIDPLGFAFK